MQDRQRIFTQKILLSLHSRFLCSLLRDQERSDLQIISVPSTSATPVRNLLRLLTTGVTVSFSREELRETEKIGKILGISLSRNIVKRLRIPPEDILSYSKRPVKIKIDNIKPNMIEMTNPCVDDLDILGILDEEMEIVDTTSRSDTVLMEDFPNTKKFRAKHFTEKIGRLKDSGLRFERLQSQLICSTETSTVQENHAPKGGPTEELTPGFPLSDDICSSQSDSGSVTLTERKLPKRKLFAENKEPRELPETEKRVRLSDCETDQRFYFENCECDLSNGSSQRPAESSSPRTPKTPLQRELYNSCEICRKRKAEDSIKSIKQKKYFQMLRDKRAEAEKYKGQKFPCEKCDYVALCPSNLKTHQMANHEGENFVDKYINDYFEKNKFLIL